MNIRALDRAKKVTGWKPFGWNTLSNEDLCRVEDELLDLGYRGEVDEVGR